MTYHSLEGINSCLKKSTSAAALVVYEAYGCNSSLHDRDGVRDGRRSYLPLTSVYKVMH